MLMVIAGELVHPVFQHVFYFRMKFLVRRFGKKKQIQKQLLFSSNEYLFHKKYSHKNSSGFKYASFMRYFKIWLVYEQNCWDSFCIVSGLSIHCSRWFVTLKNDKGTIINCHSFWICLNIQWIFYILSTKWLHVSSSVSFSSGFSITFNSSSLFLHTLGSSKSSINTAIVAATKVMRKNVISSFIVPVKL